MAVIPDQLVEIFRGNHRQLRQYTQEQQARLKDLLRETMDNLRQELKGLDPGDFRRQQGSIAYLAARFLQEDGPRELEALIKAVNEGAHGMGLAHVANEVGAWAEHYGQEMRPLNLGPVAELEASTLIEEHQASLDRYGQALARRAARELQRVPLERLNPERAVDSIQQAIEGERWRASRIVRTELSHAYNSAHFQGLKHARDSGQVSDLKKSAIATFDNRTAQDSYPVHGQVRELEEDFVDGAGRRYKHPPGRPNDREKEVPYIPSDAEIGGPTVEEGGTEGTTISDRQEGIERAERAKRRLRAKRRARRRRRVRRKDKTRKRRGLAPLDRGDTFESRREFHQLWWVNGSNTKAAVEAKAAALEEFGLDGIVWNPNNHNVPRELLPQTGKDLRRMWRDTVRELLEEGKETVTLYRGVKTDVKVQGVLESYSTRKEMARRFAGPNGHVIKEEVDVRRILMRHESDWWQNGRYGQQYEYVVMSEPPKLQWETKDFEVGFFRASELDPDAEVAGQWGIVRNADGEATLYHRPTGREMLGGEQYTKADLREAAQHLDREQFFSVKGELVRDAEDLEDALAAARMKWGQEIPDGAQAASAMELDGKLFPVRNPDVDPGSPDTWSRREFAVVLEDGTVEQVNGYTRKGICIWRDADEVGYRGSWNIGHLKTGMKFHGGPEEFYEKGHRVPFDVGGWKKTHMEEWADHFDQYLDPETGAILEGKREELEHSIQALRDEFTAAVPDEVPNLTGGEEDDDWADWLPSLGRSDDYVKPAKRRAPKAKPDKPAKKMTLEEAVERRRKALRNGRFNRYDDPELERAVQAEVKRQQEQEAQERLEAAAGRQAAQEGEVDPAQHVQQARADQARQELEKRVREFQVAEGDKVGAYVQELEEAGLADATGDDLHSALVDIRDSRRLERQRSAGEQAQERLRKSQVANVRDDRSHGQGINGSYVVDVVDPDGETHPAIFKPDAAEDLGVQSTWGIPSEGGQAAREVAAGELDTLFPGPRVVPPTVRQEGVDLPDLEGPQGGSLQKWHTDATADPLEVMRELLPEDQHRWLKDGIKMGHAGELFNDLAAQSEAMQKLTVMDAINGQWDRHGSNILWAEVDGKIAPVGIDNGLSFVGPVKQHIPRSAYPMGRPLLDATQRYAREHLPKVDPADYARAALEAGVEPRRVTEALVRLEALKENPALLETLEPASKTAYFDDVGSPWRGTWEQRVGLFVERSRIGDELVGRERAFELGDLVDKLAEELDQ